MSKNGEEFAGEIAARPAVRRDHADRGARPAADGSPSSPIVWPNGKKFAFTIIDDTDVSTVENTRGIYDLLAENGLLTTKTVWSLRAAGRAVTGGLSLEDPQYRDWILDLKERGFEIGLHGVSDGSSLRERVIRGLDYFRDAIGEDPSIYVNHVGQAEAIYWGPERLDPPVRWIYQAYRKSRKAQRFEGVDESSPYFWGDICKKRTKYVRNFVFSDINTLKMDPLMPYHDPRRPFVQYWFSSSYGSNFEAFCELLSEKEPGPAGRRGRGLHRVHALRDFPSVAREVQEPDPPHRQPAGLVSERERAARLSGRAAGLARYPKLQRNPAGDAVEVAAGSNRAQCPKTDRPAPEVRGVSSFSESECGRYKW
jgi:hypothetical protein